MSEAITVAIPTYNRASLLKMTLENVLAQDYEDFRVLVLDNASTDNTEAVVRTFVDTDQRVRYVRNETNLGMMGNSNRVIALNSSPYLSVFHDDDVMLPGFLRESVSALDQHPTAAFSFTLTRHVDFYGTPLYQLDAGDVPPGLVKGLDYLDLAISGRSFFIQTSSVVMRAASLATVGWFDSPHAKHTFDFNLYCRLAARFDVAFVPQELIHIRVHPEQESQTHWHSPTGTGKFALMAERIDAIAYLFQSERAQDSSYRRWLANRLLALNAQQSELAYPLLSNLYFTWEERLQMASQEITAVVPPGDSLILVDQDQWGSDVVKRTCIPFIERDGQYWGAPLDDNSAIQELERLRNVGASFIVFAWCAFWWLEHYSQFEQHLCINFDCVLRNPRLVVFDLRS